MKRFLAATLCLVFVMSFMFTGCGNTDTKDNNDSAANDKPKVLNVNNTSEPGHLEPGKAEGTHDSWVLEHVFEGLTKKDPNGATVAGMAANWDISDDGLVYTFHLRDGIKWSNGDPVTAGDFEYAWKYALDPATASTYAYILYYIKGAQEYNTAVVKDIANPTEAEKAKLAELAAAVGVVAKDDKTLEVTLAAPAPFFTDVAAFYTYYPINKKVQEANANWATEASSFVSNGPFKITEWKHKEKIVISKNENYYDKDKVKLSAINFAMVADTNTAWQMYRSGQLDLCFPLPPEVIAQKKAANDAELTIAPDLSTYFYRLNTTKKPFNNIKVRQALAMSIDRKSIVEDVAQGGETPAYGMVPPGIPDVSGDFQKNAGNYFAEDVAKAKQLLAEGLQEEGMKKLSFKLTYNVENVLHKKNAEAVQNMWKENLGVDVTLEGVEFQVKIDAEHALKYDASRSGWIGDYIDPMTFLDMWTSESTQNDTGWKNTEFDNLIKTAQNTMDQSVRMKAMHDAEKIFIESYAVIPLYFYTRPYTLNKNVKGVYDIVNRYPQLMFADVE